VCAYIAALGDITISFIQKILMYINVLLGSQKLSEKIILIANKEIIGSGNLRLN
jgi:hypothetical protein